MIHKILARAWAWMHAPRESRGNPRCPMCRDLMDPRPRGSWTCTPCSVEWFPRGLPTLAVHALDDDALEEALRTAVTGTVIPVGDEWADLP